MSQFRRSRFLMHVFAFHKYSDPSNGDVPIPLCSPLTQDEKGTLSSDANPHGMCCTMPSAFEVTQSAKNVPRMRECFSTVQWPTRRDLLQRSHGHRLEHEFWVTANSRFISSMVHSLLTWHLKSPSKSKTFLPQRPSVWREATWVFDSPRE